MPVRVGAQVQEVLHQPSDVTRLGTLLFLLFISMQGVAQDCGSGLAAVDIAGNCRSVPRPTMGALEAVVAVATIPPGKTAITVVASLHRDVMANIAGAAAVTASSESNSTNQGAAKAIDGVIDGWPGDFTREWATVAGGATAWIALSWSRPYLVSSVVLHDRPNANDQVTAGTLTFSDGSKVAVPSLPNDGSALTVTFAERSITALRFTVDTVASTTRNIGLAEIEVMGR